ncbi:MAG: hypothetical protein ACRCTE_13380, partial [Cellulosilyticaceae bacterium]
HREEGESQCYRLKVAEVLEGLVDVKLYNRWRQQGAEQYKIVSNLVYQINQSIEQFPRFETLAWDLWGMGYDEIAYDEYTTEDTLEQLKIINLCLGTAYWR